MNLLQTKHAWAFNIPEEKWYWFWLDAEPIIWLYHDLYDPPQITHGTLVEAMSLIKMLLDAGALNESNRPFDLKFAHQYLTVNGRDEHIENILNALREQARAKNWDSDGNEDMPPESAAVELLAAGWEWQCPFCLAENVSAGPEKEVVCDTCKTAHPVTDYNQGEA